MPLNITTLTFLSVFLLLGCASQRPATASLQAGDFTMRIQLIQDGAVLTPNKTGVYELKQAPFTIADTRSLPGIKHFFGVNFNRDNEGSQNLMSRQAQGYAIGAMTGTGAAWDERIIHLESEPLDIVAPEQAASKSYIGRDQATIQQVIKEATRDNTLPGLVCCFRRFPVHYDDTPADTDLRKRTIYGFDKEGRFPQGDVNLLLTLNRYDKTTQYITPIDVARLKLRFASD